MKKQAVTVGNCTMFATTVPVRILLDTFRSSENHCLLEIFSLIEIEDYYLVQVERYKVCGPAETINQCFINEKDARNYLEMYGIKEDQEENQDFEGEFFFY